MRSALETVQGVDGVEISPIEAGSATVQVSGKADSAALIAALEKAGYGAKVK